MTAMKKRKQDGSTNENLIIIDYISSFCVLVLAILFLFGSGHLLGIIRSYAFFTLTSHPRLPFQGCRIPT
jgi:hypothetical protein